MLTILAFNYTYTQAFGIQWLPLDIFNLLFSITVGQFMGLHFYRYSKGIRVFASILISLLENLKIKPSLPREMLHVSE